MNKFSTTKDSLEFIQKKFKDYYQKNNIELPDRFSKREFAFIFFYGKGMVRHLSFTKKKQFNEFICKRIPYHSYYSSAYYRIPNASTMQNKIWMGAELIFDLDSDHLPHSEKLSYPEQLKIVKNEFIKLVEDFLLNDFGFNKNNIELYFSGGRGYHCHVKDPNIYNLDSNERREIVDYITGRDLNDSLVFHEETTEAKVYGKRRFAKAKSLHMPTPSEPGWRGRISRGIIDIVNEIKSSEKPIENLKKYGVRKSDAERLLTELSDDRIHRIKEGKLDQSKAIRKFFLNNALRRTAVAMSAGETDEPVTCDIKRLIRLPGSLHGKTGFKVEKIEYNQLNDFDPLNKTVVLPKNSVKIELNIPFKINMCEEVFNLRKGVNKVPEYLAVFLIGRKIANLLN
jgi:DNA primase small subunit